VVILFFFFFFFFLRLGDIWCRDNNNNMSHRDLMTDDDSAEVLVAAQRMEEARLQFQVRCQAHPVWSVMRGVADERAEEAAADAACFLEVDGALVRTKAGRKLRFK
jgi:hypothetical protein